MDLWSKLTLRQLQLFAAAAEAGSFAGAAESLFVTPNAVSLAVGELEKSLDTHLVVRQRARGLVLTPSGVRLLEGARPLLHEASEVVRRVGVTGEELSGPLAIGCYSTLAAPILPGLLEGFGARFPAVELDIVDGPMSELVPRLLAGQVDVLIAYGTGLPDAVDQALLYDTEAHVLLPVDHPLADAEAVSFADFSDEPLILLDLPPSGSHTVEMLTRAGLSPRIGHRTPNFELVRSMVARGLGYGILIQKPTIDVSYEGRGIVVKKVMPQLLRDRVVVVWPRSMKLTNRAQALVEYAVETVGATQWTPARSGSA